MQREQIDAYSKIQGHQVATVHEDLDLPGSKADRPGLQRMLERVDRGTVEGVIVARLDRFGRSVVDTARNFERIHAAGGVLFSAAEGIDTRGAIGRFMLNVLSAFAEMELDRIRENWSTSREKAVARGVHIASRTPTGYVAGEDGRLVVGEDAAVITAVFKGRAGGASWGELGQLLEGVATPYGSKRWTSRSISHVISNRVYLGEARSGEFVRPGAHEPLIDEATWKQAQVPRHPRATGAPSLLAGLLRCAGCRYAMKSGKITDRQGRRVRQYRCKGLRAAGDCGARAGVLGAIVEPFVVESFFERVGELEGVELEVTGELTQAQQMRAGAEQELASFLETDIGGVVGIARFQEGARVRQARLDDADAALAAAEEAAVTVGAARTTLSETWPTLDVLGQRQLLSAAIDAIFLRSVGQANVPVSSRAVILWRGEGPRDLPGPGHKMGTIRPFDWANLDSPT